MNAATYHYFPLHSTSISTTRLEVTSSSTDLYNLLLAEFPTPNFAQSSSKHGVEHFITTKGPPVHARARCLPPDKLAPTKSELDNMGGHGHYTQGIKSLGITVTHGTQSFWGWRPCGDYRRLNDATVPERYPVPHIQDFSANLAGMRVFSKVDLIRGYHQFPVAAPDIPKTAVITPFRLYEFLRMPFGLKNAGQAF